MKQNTKEDDALQQQMLQELIQEHCSSRVGPTFVKAGGGDTIPGVALSTKPKPVSKSSTTIGTAANYNHSKDELLDLGPAKKKKRREHVNNTSKIHENNSNIGNGSTLCNSQVTYLCHLISTLSTDRESIRTISSWALSQSEHAKDISQILVWAICSGAVDVETPIPALVARIYAISDILFNSASTSVLGQGASNYRHYIQSHLKDVFNYLGLRLRMCGRLTASQLSTRVMAVVKAWKEKFLFPEDFTTSLMQLFNHPITPNIDTNTDEVIVTGKTDTGVDHIPRQKRWQEVASKETLDIDDS
jgi:hypothetical protein